MEAGPKIFGLVNKSEPAVIGVLFYGGKYIETKVRTFHNKCMNYVTPWPTNC
jgi:hypothetical protein